MTELSKIQLKFMTLVYYTRIASKNAYKREGVGVSQFNNNHNLMYMDSQKTVFCYIQIARYLCVNV